MALEVGARYLTVSGLPVQVAQIAADRLVLHSLVSDNRISVPASYPLYPMGRREPAFETRTSPYSRRPERAATGAGSRPLKQLAPIIDAMLLAGNMTMSGIVREVRRKASAACLGRDLKANVRARIYWFKRKGCRLEPSAQSRLHIVPPRLPAKALDVPPRLKVSVPSDGQP